MDYIQPLWWNSGWRNSDIFISRRLATPLDLSQKNLLPRRDLWRHLNRVNYTTLHYTILSSPSRRQIDNRVDQRVNEQKCFSSLRSRGWVASWSRRLRRRRRLRQQTWCDYLAKPGKSVKFENKFQAKKKAKWVWWNKKSANCLRSFGRAQYKSRGKKVILWKIPFG